MKKHTKKTCAQDSFIALGYFMNTLGELSKANLGDIHQMEKQEGTCRTLHHAWRKFNTRYAYYLTSLVTTIERKLNELPTPNHLSKLYNFWIIYVSTNISCLKLMITEVEDMNGQTLTFVSCYSHEYDQDLTR